MALPLPDELGAFEDEAADEAAALPLETALALADLLLGADALEAALADAALLTLRLCPGDDDGLPLAVSLNDTDGEAETDGVCLLVALPPPPPPPPLLTDAAAERV